MPRTQPRRARRPSLRLRLVKARHVDLARRDELAQRHDVYSRAASASKTICRPRDAPRIVAALLLPLLVASPLRHVGTFRGMVTSSGGDGGESVGRACGARPLSFPASRIAAVRSGRLLGRSRATGTVGCAGTWREDSVASRDARTCAGARIAQNAVCGRGNNSLLRCRGSLCSVDDEPLAMCIDLITAHTWVSAYLPCCLEREHHFEPDAIFSPLCWSGTPSVPITSTRPVVLRIVFTLS